MQRETAHTFITFIIIALHTIRVRTWYTFPLRILEVLVGALCAIVSLVGAGRTLSVAWSALGEDPAFVLLIGPIGASAASTATSLSLPATNATIITMATTILDQGNIYIALDRMNRNLPFPGAIYMTIITLLSLLGLIAAVAAVVIPNDTIDTLPQGIFSFVADTNCAGTNGVLPTYAET